MATRRLDLIITSNATAAIRGFVNLGGAANAAERKFGRFAGTAAKALTGVAAVGAAFAVQSARAFISFDDQMNKSLAIMGEVSGPMRNRMEAAAKSVATVTRFSAIEAAEAYYDLASAGLTAEQSVQALPLVAKFAQAGMMDLATAGEHLAGAQSALGLKTDDAAQNLTNMTRVADVLTHANNIALGTVEDFAEALSNKAAGALRANNKSLEEGVAVLAAFASQGITGATAGEKLAIVLRDVPRAAKRNAEEFAKFGISVFDANGNLKNMADVVAEFEQGLGGMSDGQKAAAYETLGLTRSVGDILRVLSGTSGQIREFEGELNKAGGTTERVANKQMQSLQAKLDVLKNKFHNLMITVGEPIAIWFVDTLIPWIEDTAVPTIESLAGAITETLAPAFSALETVFGNEAVQDVSMAYGALLLSFHGTPVAVDVVKGAFNTLGRSASTLNSVFVAPLVDSFKDLYHLLWTDLPAAFARFNKWLKGTTAWSAASAAVNGLSASFAGLWTTMAPIIIPLAGVVASIAVLAGLTKVVADNWGEWWTALTLFLGPLGIAAFILGAIISNLDKIKRFGATLWDGVKEGASAFADALSGAWAAVTSSAADAWVAIYPILVAIRDFVMGALVASFQGLAAVASSAWNGVILPVLQTLADFIAGVLGPVFAGLGAAAGFVFGILRDTAIDTWNNGLKPVFEQISSLVRNVVIPTFNDMKTAATTVFEAIGGFISTVVIPAFSLLGEVVSGVFSVVGVVVSAVWNESIKPAWEAIVSFVNEDLMPAFRVVAEEGRKIFREIGSAISMAWSEAIRPALSAIRDFLVTKLGPVFSFIGRVASVVFAGIGRVFGFLGNVASVVFARIGQVISLAWTNVIGPALGAIGRFITDVLVPAFQRFAPIVIQVMARIGYWILLGWTKLIAPALRALAYFLEYVVIPAFVATRAAVATAIGIIGAIISTAWTAVIKPTFDAIVWVIANVVVPTFNFLWATVQSVWSLIGSAIAAAWNVVIKPIWQGIWNFITLTLIPKFQEIWTTVFSTWEAIKSGLSAAWTWIRDNVWNPIVNFITLTLIPKFTSIKDKALSAFNGIKDAMKGIWDGIVGFVKSGVNSAIGVVNKLIRGINKVLGLIPGLGSLKIPEIATIGGGSGGGSGKASQGGRKAGARPTGFAEGGIPPAKVGNGFVTNGPRAIVGEGRQAYPEFVIPTDPAHRKNALGLYQKLGWQLLAGGGYLGLDPRFGAAVQKVVQESGGRVFVRSGLRSRAQQEYLYGEYLAGRGNLAARPGTSKHERGLAVDFGGSVSVWQQLARKHGLVFPVRGENWHAEPSWAGGGTSGGGGGGGRFDLLDALGGGIFGMAGGWSGLAEATVDQAWDAIVRATNPLIDDIPWKVARGTVRWFRDQVGNWVKNQQNERNAAMGEDAYAPGGAVGAVGGGVAQWRNTALEALRITGHPASWVDSLLRRMQQESGGNPKAINNWDSNARKGQQSRGLMQTIPSTFMAYAGAYRNRGIFDPLANIIASINYAVSRYGSGPAGWNKRGGYKHGGVVDGDQLANVHDEEMVLPRRLSRFVQEAAANQSSGATIRIENITIHANTEEGGRRAAKGFMDTLAERRIMVDARVR